MAMTLFVRTPFEINHKDTVISGMLCVHGGSILDILTDKIHNEDRTLSVALPFITNFIYYNIEHKEFYVYDDDSLEDTTKKLLYRVYKVDGVIDSILNLYDDNIIYENINVDPSLLTVPQNIKNEQNIAIPFETGDIIPVIYTPKEVITIAIAFQESDKVIYFGQLDLEHINNLENQKINMNFNLVKAVSKKLDIPLTEISIDVTYSY